MAADAGGLNGVSQNLEDSIDPRLATECEAKLACLLLADSLARIPAETDHGRGRLVIVLPPDPGATADGLRLHLRSAIRAVDADIDQILVEDPR